MNSPRPRFDYAAAVLIVAALLLVPAVINGFPFIFMDSTDYIILTPRVYRSPFYQIFLFATSFKGEIWFAVAAQALLCSGVIGLFLTLRGASPRRLVACGVVLATVSTLATFVGFIMPDVFTGLMFLCAYMILFDWRALSALARLAVAAVLVLAAAVHLSHLAMLAGLVGACAVIGLAWRRSGVSFAGLAVVAASLGAVLCGYLAYNAVVFRKASVSPAGSVFLMANLIEYGPARRELAAVCPAAGFRLCAYREQLPPTANDLLWTPGPLQALGGFAGMAEESRAIVNATMRDRPLDVIGVALGNFARAIVHVAPATDIVPLVRAPVVRSIIATTYDARTLAAFTASRQERGRYPVAIANALAAIGLVGALALLVAVIAFVPAARSVAMLRFPAFAVAAWLGDALVCGAISGVFDRYQARVCWLVVLAALAMVVTLRRGGRVAITTPRP